MGNGISILTVARLALDAIEATQLEYLIGGSFALYVWGDVRTTLRAFSPFPVIRSTGHT